VARSDSPIVETPVLTSRGTFYLRVVRALIQERNASILVCGGGTLDKNVFQALGFKNVVISNIDQRMLHADYAPFAWKYENAENLSYPDATFDYVVAHAALHHASAPHRVLLEMYRVAKKGVLAIENRDSALMRVMQFCRLTHSYEHAAVFGNDCATGGVNNTHIPNYIYRWTEREIEKTIRSYEPQFAPKIRYAYGTAFPCFAELERNGAIKYLCLKALQPLHWVLAKLFPRQQNLFAFFIDKDMNARKLQPWLKTDGVEGPVVFDKAWGERKYRDVPIVDSH
jgi:ubiquinone/menaquinone biosynthesis C-methylase UbiE